MLWLHHHEPTRQQQQVSTAMSPSCNKPECPLTHSVHAGGSSYTALFSIPLKYISLLLPAKVVSYRNTQHRNAPVISSGGDMGFHKGFKYVLINLFNDLIWVHCPGKKFLWNNHDVVCSSGVACFLPGGKVQCKHPYCHFSRFFLGWYFRYDCVCVYSVFYFDLFYPNWNKCDGGRGAQQQQLHCVAAQCCINMFVWSNLLFFCY